MTNPPQSAQCDEIPTSSRTPTQYTFHANHNPGNAPRAKGKSHQRKRSERVERSFAHVCETGGGRRSWLRGLEKINKRYSIQTAARNLGLLMLKLFGIGKPRGLQVADRPWRGEAAAMGAAWGDGFRLWALPMFRWSAIRRLSALAGPRQRLTALAA